MVHLRPQTPQEESLAKPETHLLIILSLVCKYDMKEVHGNYTHPVFSKKVHGQKRPWKVDKCRKSSPYIIVSKYWQHPVHKSSLSPSVKHLNANKYKCRARRLFFLQLGSRTTIKQYRLVRNRNLLGHTLIICMFTFYFKISMSEARGHAISHWCSFVDVVLIISVHFDTTGTRNTFQRI